MQTFGNNVVFQFVEKALMGRFINSHHGGLLISSEDTYQTNLPRWGKAAFTGDGCTEVKSGDYILIEGGKWTTGFEVDGVRYWKTDESVILCVSDEPGTTF